MELKKLTEQRNKIDESIELIESRLRGIREGRTQPEKKESTVTVKKVESSPKAATATEQILNPDFQPHLMPWDEYKKLFRQAQRENQDNQKNQIALNNKHNKYKSDRKLFLKDENGNVICYDNTTIPRPREREFGEDVKTYHKFLNEKYGPAIEDYYKKQAQKDNPQKRIEEKKPVGLIEEKEGKQLPAIFEKQLPAVVEEKKPTPNPTPNPIPIPKEERKTLQQIMYELQKGLEIKAKSGKRYQAANIKVAKNFKNELKWSA